METPENKIHIALGFDENYIVPVYALLTSIFYNNKSNVIAFHAIATGLNELQKEELIKFVARNNAQIFFYQIDEDEVRKSVIVPPDSQFTIATYYRLYFHALIPEEVNKLLYIDADTIVIGDLRELYNIDIGNAPIAAVADPVNIIRTDLGLYKEGQYFNAGILLIDTKNWKEQKVTERALQFILDYPDKIQYVDQDALNATLIDEWFKIDKRYNLSYLYVSLQVPGKELIKDAVIVHYTTSLKPWHCLARNKLRYLYHHYLKLSPRSNERKYIDFKWTPGIVRTFIRMRIKEFYFDKEIYKIFPIKSWINAGEIY